MGKEVGMQGGARWLSANSLAFQICMRVWLCMCARGRGQASYLHNFLVGRIWAWDKRTQSGVHRPTLCISFWAPTVYHHSDKCLVCAVLPGTQSLGEEWRSTFQRQIRQGPATRNLLGVTVLQSFKEDRNPDPTPTLGLFSSHLQFRAGGIWSRAFQWVRFHPIHRSFAET